MSHKPEQVKLTQEEADTLIAHIESGVPLTEHEKKIVKGTIRFNLWLAQQLQLAKLSIARLKGIFGIKTEKKNTKITGTTSSSPSAEGQEPCNPDTRPVKAPPQRDPSKNHGRLGYADYSGCETVTLSHDTLKAGGACPACEQCASDGKLYPMKPGVILRLVGQPIITGTRYQVEKLRCNLCNKIYSAAVPEEIAKQAKYAPNCGPTIAFARYYMGQPFHRVEQWQAAYGIPLADSTQWDKVHALYQAVAPVVGALETVAAESNHFHYDDTGNNILSPTLTLPRKGIYTTAVVAEVDGYLVYLFYTSERYAAENVTPLLEKRCSEAPFFTMSDALNRNKLKRLPENVLAAWICCFCLVHGRRKFFESVDFFEPQCRLVLEVIGTVYANEKHCYQTGLDPGERLAYHQAHSAPKMAALHVWLMNQRRFSLTEPNSGLGKAIDYMLKHWQQLTRFLHYPGAMIDNSLCERAIKVVIRHRRNSLFFRTSYSAQVGDGFMSVLHTAVRCGINPVAYLTTLQTHRDAVADNPKAWLPWRYQAHLAQAA